MDQLNQDLTALQTALTNVVNDVANLSSGEPDPNDAVVSSMVTALEAAGYGVTAPASPELELPVDDGSAPVAED